MSKEMFVAAYLAASEDVKALFNALFALDREQRERAAVIVRKWLLSEDRSEEALRAALFGK